MLKIPYITILTENKNANFLFGFFLVIILGYTDFLMGYAFSFSLFYLIPIIIVSWYSGIKSGIIISLVSSFAWFTADTLTSPGYPHFLVPYWNATIRLGFFLTVTILLVKLHRSLEREKVLARKDNLTNTWNRLAFYEIAKIECARAKRNKYPITLAYIDLDNFKMVNDQLGHHVGDELLITVATVIQKNIRISDVLARLGGDEFILLLPETESEAALSQIRRLRQMLLQVMKRRAWPVTFSIGMITFINLEDSIEDMLTLTDNLMYKVKKNLKNDIIHEKHT